MPNLIKKSWTVSNQDLFIWSVDEIAFQTTEYPVKDHKLLILIYLKSPLKMIEIQTLTFLSLIFSFLMAEAKSQNNFFL